MTESERAEESADLKDDGTLIPKESWPRPVKKRETWTQMPGSASHPFD